MHTDVCTFMITARWILPRMRNVSEKNIFRENKNIHLMFNKFLFEIRTVYERMWQNGRARRSRKYSIFIADNTRKNTLLLFPRPQWLREHASLLRCTCTSRLAELSRCVWRYIPMCRLVNGVYNYVTIMIYTHTMIFFFYKGCIWFLALAPWIVRLFDFFVPLCLLCL